MSVCLFMKVHLMPSLKGVLVCVEGFVFADGGDRRCINVIIIYF